MLAIVTVGKTRKFGSQLFVFFMCDVKTIRIRSNGKV